MKTLLRFIALISLVGLTFSTYSQSTNVKRLERKVTVHFELEEFFQAIPYLKELETAFPNNPLYQYQLGVAHWFSAHQHDAYPYFKRAEQLGHGAERLPFFRARTEHLEHHFTKAISYYTQYRTSLSTTTIEEEEEFKKIEKYIQQCHVGNILKVNELEVEIEHLAPPINSKYPEYVPVVDAEEKFLVFTTCRPENKGSGVDLYTGHYFEDIYLVENQNGTWGKPEPISGKINTTNHDANVAISPDGKYLITYYGYAPLGGDLFLSAFEEKKNGDIAWSAPKPFPEPINSDDQEPSASFSADMNTLFFSSDRPGGYGGLDIYYSVKDASGKWGEAINLGPIVNSAEHEDAPHIHADGKTLFFSSKGHTNMGGFDIFYSEYDSLSGRWLVPENIGYPINTADDDIYFHWCTDATRGYFSSFRADTYGEKDLYIMHRPQDKQDMIIVKGYITDSISGDPVDGNITVTNHEDHQLVGVYPTNPETGKYKFAVEQGKSYDIAVESDGFTYYEGQIDVPKKTAYFEVAENINVKPYRKETTLAFQEDAEEEIELEADGMTPKAKKDPSFEAFDAKSYNDNVKLQKGDKIVLRSVYFDFDKSKLKPESYSALDEMATMLSQQGQIIMEVSGHTDSIGRKGYNKRLSKRRAKAVARYLIRTKSVKRRRLAAVGYGETRPIAANTTTEGRALNRRTEFRVIKEIDLADIKDEDKVDLSDLEENNIQTKPAPKAPLGNFDPGQVLPYKVHFPYGWETEITDYSKSRLEMISAILRANPAMRLRIHSHADPLGASLEDNRTVSDLRAKTVKKYLTDRGIDATRLEIASYGAARPLLNSNDIGANVVNRRVEFEVLP